MLWSGVTEEPRSERPQNGHRIVLPALSERDSFMPLLCGRGVTYRISDGVEEESHVVALVGVSPWFAG